MVAKAIVETARRNQPVQNCKGNNMPDESNWILWRCDQSSGPGNAYEYCLNSIPESAW